MRRAKLIFLVVLAAIAGAAPLLAAYGLSRDNILSGEQRHLQEYAGWTLKRAETTLDQSKAAVLAANDLPLADCSPEHIAQMRRITVQNPVVDEIGFFHDGRLACSSWGKVASNIPIGTPQEITDDGFGLSFNVHPEADRSVRMVAIRKGAYNALVNPRRMVDVLSDTEMVLGLAQPDGTIIGANAPVDPVLVRDVIRAGDKGAKAHHLFAVVASDGLVPFAISDSRRFSARLAEERTIFLALALVASGVLVGAVLWLSRQRPSPRKALEVAIRRREFIVHYQPIIRLSSGRCVGAEALIRWRRPDGGMVPPDQFIPLAEETGLIAPLTDLLIDRVVADLAGALAQDRGIHIAINLSPADIESGRFLPVLDGALKRTGIDPRQIWLEATERGFMDAEAAQRTLEMARERGHFVAIDDFGTGYSCLSVLEKLPLDALKIDKSFVDAIGRNAAASVVTPHIIDIAKNLKFQIVAEGVETVEQEDYLLAAGVEYAQGWRYSKALPANAFVTFCQARNATRRETVVKLVA